jgi:hypothetical protein
MNAVYKETGGLRWGDSDWWSAHASWPFATLTASPDGLHIAVNCMGLWKNDFDFRKADIVEIRRRKSILPFSTGIVIEHNKSDYPQFVLFWTFNYQRLKTELTRLGFAVLENGDTCTPGNRKRGNYMSRYKLLFYVAFIWGLIGSVGMIVAFYLFWS